MIFFYICYYYIPFWEAVVCRQCQQAWGSTRLKVWEDWVPSPLSSAHVQQAATGVWKALGAATVERHSWKSSNVAVGGHSSETQL